MRLVRTWSQRSKAQRKEIKDRERAWKLKRDALVRQLKAVPCADCKSEYPSEAMDFDHVPGRGGKLGAVCDRPTLRAVLDEARKCDVVCSNCHRTRTRQRLHGKRRERIERENWLDGIAAAVEREREALKALSESH